MITFKRGEVIKLPLKRKRNRVFLTPNIAQTVMPREIVPGTNMSTITGYLEVKDNLHDINVIEPLADDTKRQAPPNREEILRKLKYEWGGIDVDLFLKKLMQDGITDIKVEQNGPGSVTIMLVGEDTSIQIEEKNTHIVCGGKQSLRMKLRDLLLQCVQKI